MRGLPYSIVMDDIVQFFAGHGLVEDSIKIGKMDNGKLTGEACVMFESLEDCEKAFKDRNQEHIGSRWIELFRVSASEHSAFDKVQATKFEHRGERGGRGRGRGGFGGRGGYNRDRDDAKASESTYGQNKYGYNKQPREGGQKTYQKFGGNTEGSYNKNTVRLSDYVT